MKTKVVKLSELMEDNPKLCMSTLRVFERCHECDKFRMIMRGLHKRTNIPIPEAIKQAITELNCNPKVNQRVIELYTKKVQLLAELRKVEDEINDL